MSAPSGGEGERRRQHHGPHRHRHECHGQQPRGSMPHQQQHRRRGRGDGDLVPLAALISRELKSEKMERPKVRYGCAAQSKKGEDYFLMKEDCQRVPGSTSSTFSVFAIFDGHNGNAAAIPPLARPCAYGCRAGMHESESGGFALNPFFVLLH